jgi:hypothetical protein
VSDTRNRDAFVTEVQRLPAIPLHAPVPQIGRVRVVSAAWALTRAGLARRGRIGEVRLTSDSSQTQYVLARPDLHAQETRNGRSGPHRQRRAPPPLLRRLAGHDRGPHEASAEPLQRLGRQ